MHYILIKALIMAMCRAVIAWFIYGVALAGWGLAFRRFFGLRARSADDLLFAPWIGWALLIGFLQIWHFFLPVTGITAGVVVFLGLAGLSLNYRDLREVIKGNLRLTISFAAVILCVSIFMAYQGTEPSANYDTGLYHIPCIRWTSEYSIVPGLANLRFDRAFNNSSFLYVAMLNWGPFFNKYHHIASGLLIVLFLARSLWSLGKLMKTGQQFAVNRLIDVCLIVPVIGLAVDKGVGSSPTPDLPMFLLDVIIASETVRLLFRTSKMEAEKTSPPSSYSAFLSEHREDVYSFACLLILAVVRVTVKFSGVSTLAVMCVLSLVILRRFRVSLNALTKIVFRVGLVPGIIFVAWACRGIILSGYPFFPSTFCGVNVNWRFPLSNTIELQRIIKAYPRMPGPGYMKALEGWGWLRGWLDGIAADLSVVTPVLLCVAMWFLFCWTNRSGAKNRIVHMSRTDKHNYLLFLLLPVSSIMLCLIKAPQPRYAGAHFWLLGAGALAFWLSNRRREVVFSVLLVYSVMTFAQQVNILDVTHRYLYYIGPLKSGDVKLVKAPSGLEVYMPKDPENDRCCNAPLPNTGHLDPRLRLRVPGDLSKGFTVQQEEEH